jgi:hypothetical protein
MRQVLVVVRIFSQVRFLESENSPKLNRYCSNLALGKFMKITSRILSFGILGAVLLAASSSMASIKVFDQGSNVTVYLTGADAGQVMSALNSNSVQVASQMRLSCSRVRSLTCALNLILGQKEGFSVYRDSIRVNHIAEEPVIVAEMTATEDAAALYDALGVPARSVGGGGRVKSVVTSDGAFRIDCTRYGSLSYCSVNVSLSSAQ